MYYLVTQAHTYTVTPGSYSGLEAPKLTKPTPILSGENSTPNEISTFFREQTAQLFIEAEEEGAW